MSSVIAIWAAAVATADTIARISVILAGAAAPGTARRTGSRVADDHDGAPVAAADGPAQSCAAGATGTASATGAAR